jgi:hypothetical protein
MSSEPREIPFRIFESGPEAVTRWEENEKYLVGYDAAGRILVLANKAAVAKVNFPEPDNVFHMEGRDALSTWFGLSYASWLTIPRVLMEAMPDVWQNQMAALLNEYSSTFSNFPDGWGTRVQLTQDGKLTKTPSVLLGYRHPDRDFVNSLRTPKEPS